MLFCIHLTLYNNHFHTQATFFFLIQGMAFVESLHNINKYIHTKIALIHYTYFEQNNSNMYIFS